jgi:hypothetical protein
MLAPIDTCFNCGVELKAENTFVHDFHNCVSSCRRCFAVWIETQINDGKAVSLKCPCGNHPLLFKHVRSVFGFLTDVALALYNDANRRRCAFKKSAEIRCPECNSAYNIYEGTTTYQCTNPPCNIRNVEICTKHNVNYTRGVYDPTILRQAPKRCAKCLDEANNSTIVCDLLTAIRDGLCDRCPNCQGYVGEPETFESCMCLKCNFCPHAFCGFCYKFGSDWRSTHEHVRHCPLNPRENYFVESEAIWRQLMRARRLAISESIIAAAPRALTAEELSQVRNEVLRLL